MLKGSVCGAHPGAEHDRGVASVLGLGLLDGVRQGEQQLRGVTRHNPEAAAAPFMHWVMDCPKGLTLRLHRQRS